MTNRRAIFHKSVRPNETSYDAEYYLDNMEYCSKIEWLPGQPDHQYVTGKIQDNDTLYPVDRVIY